jgi:hypothetical protein
MDLNTLLPVIVFAVFVLIAFGMFALMIRQGRRHHEKVKALAPRLSLAFTGPAADLEKVPGPEALKPYLQTLMPWRLEGSRSGYAVALFLESRGSGKSRTSYTVIEAALNKPLPFDFQAGKEHALLILGKTLFRMQDIEVGVAAFDAAVRLRGENTEAVKALFSDPILRNALLQALESHPEISLSASKAHWEVPGSLLDEAKIDEVLDLVASLAASLERANRG